MPKSGVRFSVHADLDGTDFFILASIRNPNYYPVWLGRSNGSVRGEKFAEQDLALALALFYIVVPYLGDKAKCVSFNNNVRNLINGSLEDCLRFFANNGFEELVSEQFEDKLKELVTEMQTQLCNPEFLADTFIPDRGGAHSISMQGKTFSNTQRNLLERPIHLAG